MRKPQFDHLELDFGGPAPSLTGSGSHGAPAPAAEVTHAGVPVRPVEGEEPVVGLPRVLTVSQLTRRIRTLLEGHLGMVRVEGELSNVRRQGNGHTYFTLKDEGSQLACVLFRGYAHAGMPALTDGSQVQAAGELTVYEPRGQYQLIVHDLEASGAGVLQARFEALKRKLAAEGLFDPARKRSLPPFPQCIALVTSPSGAAVRDLLNVLGRRAPWIRVLVLPVRVQGPGACQEIVQALTTLSRPLGGGLAQPDVIVVARGGGSIEDLWCFNEEEVARSMAASPIPVVSAVGHEIDFTIADFVADLRAPTPSAAAELIAPDGPELRRWLEATRQAMTSRIRRSLEHARTIIDLLARGGLAREPARLFTQWSQQADLLGQDLTQAINQALRVALERTDRLALQLGARHPAQRIDQRRQSLAALGTRLRSAIGFRLAAADERLRRAASLVNSLGPQRVLERGFTYTTGPDGHALTSVTGLRPGDALTTRTAAGQVRSTVTATEPVRPVREP